MRTHAQTHRHKSPPRPRPTRPPPLMGAGCPPWNHQHAHTWPYRSSSSTYARLGMSENSACRYAPSLATGFESTFSTRRCLRLFCAIMKDLGMNEECMLRTRASSEAMSLNRLFAKYKCVSSLHATGSLSRVDESLLSANSSCDQ